MLWLIAYLHWSFNPGVHFASYNLEGGIYEVFLQFDSFKSKSVSNKND